MLRRIALPLALLGAAVLLSGCLKNANDVPPAPRVVQIPTSIDGTGRTDVSRAFSAFLASVPDGTTVELVPNAQYRMESTLVLANRNGLTIEGNNAKIFLTTPGDRTRSNVLVQGGSNIVFRNLRVQGANPHGGSGADAYVASKEAQDGFNFQGVHNVWLDAVTVTDTYGDFVEITRQYPANNWSENVRITGSHFARNGRQGITLMGARNVVIESNTFSDMARATFDFEPGGIGWGVEHVVVTDNDVSSGRLFFVAAAGSGPVNDVTISGNRLHNEALQVYVKNKGGSIRHDWHVLNNTSDLPLTNPQQAAMQFWKVNGVEVHGNRQPFKKGILMYGVRAYNSCGLSLGSNTYQNAAAQSLVSGGC